MLSCRQKVTEERILVATKTQKNLFTNILQTKIGQIFLKESSLVGPLDNLTLTEIRCYWMHLMGA